jgi:hypothetical protein
MLSLSECIQLKRSQGYKNSGDDIQIFTKTSQVEIHRQPEHVTAETVPRYQVGDPDARHYFIENGFVVVREVATEIGKRKRFILGLCRTESRNEQGRSFNLGGLKLQENRINQHRNYRWGRIRTVGLHVGSPNSSSGVNLI